MDGKDSEDGSEFTNIFGNFFKLDLERSLLFLFLSSFGFNHTEATGWSNHQAHKGTVTGGNASS